MNTIRVLVADDHTILREGLVALLDDSGDCRVIAQAADGMQAVELALQTEPDVIVLDISMPKLNGIEVIRRLSKELDKTRILVLTMHAEEEYVLHVVRAGASGFLLKDSAGERPGLFRCTRLARARPAGQAAQQPHGRSLPGPDPA
jgi:two-component system, NarL family, response regulator NreC